MVHRVAPLLNFETVNSTALLIAFLMTLTIALTFRIAIRLLGRGSVRLRSGDLRLIAMMLMIDSTAEPLLAQ